jgi:glycosyltransferase involved in cell wall biosynthesis
MHILEICLSPDLGGLELYVFRTAAALSNSERVSTLLCRDGKLLEYFEQLPQVAQHFVPVTLRKLPLLAARQLARLIDAQEIDVLHVHWGKDLPLAAFAKYLSRRKPRLVYTRQMQLTRSKRDLYHNFLYSQMDMMLTITEQLAASARDKLRTADRDKVHTLYYGVEAPATALRAEQRQALREEWGVPADAMLIGLFGRMEPYKGQHLFIEALASAKREGLAVYGLLVGHEMEAGYSDVLKEQAAALGVLERLVFRGFTKDPKPWMQSCDVLLLATVEETFGLVLPEAMRAGVAVIGSNRGGVLEIIDHEKNGLLFESGGSDSLYAQIKRYANDTAFHQKMAQAGKADADQRFDVEHHYGALKDIFHSLINTAASDVT